MVGEDGVEERHQLCPSAVERPQRAKGAGAEGVPLAQIPLGGAVRHVFANPLVIQDRQTPSLEPIAVAEVAEGILIRSTRELLERAPPLPEIPSWIRGEPPPHFFVPAKKYLSST